MPPRVTSGQHPYDVARACVRSAERWAADPLGVWLARMAVAPYRPADRDLTGSWLPDALLQWARSLAYYREPPLDGELVYALPLVLAAGGGDCDDLAASQATIAASMGVPARIGVIWPHAPTGPVAHVFCAVGTDWVGAGPTPRAWRCVDPDLSPHPDPCRRAGVRWFDLTPGGSPDGSITGRMYRQP